MSAATTRPTVGSILTTVAELDALPPYAVVLGDPECLNDSPDYRRVSIQKRPGEDSLSGDWWYPAWDTDIFNALATTEIVHRFHLGPFLVLWIPADAPAVEVRSVSAGETNYVAGLAMHWAGTDPMEQWVNAAPEGGPTPIDETIREYLGSHNPFPDESAVEVLRQGGSIWEPAVIVERTSVDEWTVEYEDGEQAWRDQHELRPAAAGEAAA